MLINKVMHNCWGYSSAASASGPGLASFLGRRPLYAAGIGLWVLLVLSSPASATDAAQAYADAVLSALATKGLLTEQEVHDIKLQARQAAAQARPSGTSGQPSKAPVAAAKSDFPAYRVWGRLQPRYTYTPSRHGRQGTNSFTFRRARVGLKGYLAPGIAFRTQYEASNDIPDVLANATNLLDAWVRFEHFNNTIGDIVVGQQFVPGYSRAPQLGASVERKFPEFLAPGTAGRARGITLRRGDMGLPEASGPGILGNHLQYSVGLFNGPDLAVNNDNNELMFAAVVGWRPQGISPFPDEYEVRDLPLRLSFNAGYATSSDVGSRDAKTQARLLAPAGGAIKPVKLRDDWYTLYAEGAYHHWFGWAHWERFVSDGKNTPLAAAGGRLRDRLDSRAWTLGLSRTFPLPGEYRFWGAALQYQQVDNQHPSRTRLFDVLTGSPANGIVRGMNRGGAYQAMLTYIFNRNMRLINEYTLFDPRDGGFDHDVWVSQLQVDF